MTDLDDEIAAVTKNGSASETQSREELEDLYADDANNTSHEPREERIVNVKLSEIEIGKRLRKKVRDIPELAENITRPNGLLQPIIINKDKKLVTGYRRYKAYEYLGLTEIPCIVRNFPDELQAEYDENVQRQDFSLWDIPELVEIIKQTRTSHRPSKNKKGVNSTSLSSFSEVKGKSRDLAGNIAGHSGPDIDNICKWVKEAETHPELVDIINLADLPKADKRNISLQKAHRQFQRILDKDKPQDISPSEWAKRLEGMTDEERFAAFGKGIYQNRTPVKYNAIMIMEPDPRLGFPDYPGKTSCAVVMNFLYQCTKQNDLVVDPMCGGGTTLDTCCIFNRRCLASDIRPVRSDIYLHDISKGFPAEANGCDAIFLDPPYLNLMEYCKESISHASLEEFLSYIAKLAKDSFATLKPSGHVGLVMMPIKDEKEGNEDNFVNLPYECIKLFREAGFKEVDDWEIPLPPHVKSGSQANKAKRKKSLLNLHRRLIIFKAFL